MGAKVADCVCLMSLDKHEAVPVDTHLWQITTKHYMPHLVKTKSLTAKVYKQIGEQLTINGVECMEGHWGALNTAILQQMWQIPQLISQQESC